MRHCLVNHGGDGFVGVDDAGVRVPEDLGVERDLRPSAGGFFGAEEFVVDAAGRQHGGQAFRFTEGAVVHGAGGGDELFAAEAGQFVPSGLRLLDEAGVELFRVGVAEDPGGAVGAAGIVGGC